MYAGRDAAEQNGAEQSRAEQTVFSRSDDCSRHSGRRVVIELPGLRTDQLTDSGSASAAGCNQRQHEECQLGNVLFRRSCKGGFLLQNVRFVPSNVTDEAKMKHFVVPRVAYIAQP